MNENQNKLTQLERRLVPSSVPERLADASVLLMQRVDEKAMSLAGFIGPELGGPVALLGSPMKLIPKNAGIPTQEVHVVLPPRYEAHSHWGLNE